MFSEKTDEAARAAFEAQQRAYDAMAAAFQKDLVVLDSVSASHLAGRDHFVAAREADLARLEVEKLRIEIEQLAKAQHEFAAAVAKLPGRIELEKLAIANKTAELETALAWRKERDARDPDSKK